MRTSNVTLPSILGLALCGLLVTGADDLSPAAARGMGGLHHSGGLTRGSGRSAHHTSHNTSHTGSRTARHHTTGGTGHNTTTTVSTGRNTSGSGSATTSGGGTSGTATTVSTGRNTSGSGSATTSGGGTSGTTTTVSTGRSSSGSGSHTGGNGGDGGGTPGTATTVSIAPGRGSGIPVLLPPGGGGGAATQRGGGGAGGGGGGGGAPPRGQGQFVANEVITEFDRAATPQSINRFARRYNLSLLQSQGFPLIGSTFYRWRILGRRTVPNMVGAIEIDRLVASVQPNHIFFTVQEDAAAASSETSADAAQYALRKLHIAQAHRLATGKGVPIALIDSEIDADHPDLKGTIAQSFDALGAPEKPHSHGTAMAGAIAAHGKLSGIDVGPRLLAARAFDSSAGAAKGVSFAIYRSLQWAADNGARVVNMSFAGPADPILHRMLAAAYAKGMVLIAAAGNAGPQSAPLYPAADPAVIAVTATDFNDDLFSMANRGQYIAIAAPGVAILALAPGKSYQLTTGTSVAAAHVSGIAALLLEDKPSLTPADIRTVLMTTAKPLGATGGHADFGAGLANAYHALEALNEKPAVKPDEAQAKP